MLGSKLAPLVVFLLVQSSGNFFSTGIKYRTDGQTGLGMLVGGYF